MIHKDKSTIQRMLGQIEGAACAIDNECAANLIYEATLTISDILEKDGSDNAKSSDD